MSYSHHKVPYWSTYNRRNLMTSPIHCDSDDESNNGGGILLLQEAQRAPAYLQLTIDSDVDEPEQTHDVTSSTQSDIDDSEQKHGTDSSDSEDEVIILGEKRPTYEEITLEEDEEGDVVEKILTFEKANHESQKEVEELLYQCPDCDKRFRAESLLKFHLKMHNSGEHSTSSRISDALSAHSSPVSDSNLHLTPVHEDSCFTPPHKSSGQSILPCEISSPLSPSVESGHQSIHTCHIDHTSPSITPVYESDNLSPTPTPSSSTYVHENSYQLSSPLNEKGDQSWAYQYDHQSFTPLYEEIRLSSSPVYESNHESNSPIYDDDQSKTTICERDQQYSPEYKNTYNSSFSRCENELVFNISAYESENLYASSMYDCPSLRQSTSAFKDDRQCNSLDDSDHQSTPMYDSDHRLTPIYENDNLSLPEYEHQSRRNYLNNYKCSHSDSLVTNSSHPCDNTSNCVNINCENNYKLMKMSKKKRRHSSAKRDSDSQKRKLKRSHKHKVHKEKHKSHKKKKHKKNSKETQELV